MVRFMSSHYIRSAGEFHGAEFTCRAPGKKSLSFRIAYDMRNAQYPGAEYWKGATDGFLFTLAGVFFEAIFVGTLKTIADGLVIVFMPGVWLVSWLGDHRTDDIGFWVLSSFFNWIFYSCIAFPVFWFTDRRPNQKGISK